MNDTAFVFLKIIVSACAALLTVVIIPYVHTLRSNAQFNSLVEMITLMVQAAEQTIRQSGKGGQSDTRNINEDGKPAPRGRLPV
jgi:hypothetical protein